MPNVAVFAIDITHTRLTAAFVHPDGTEEDSASFDLADFTSGDSDYTEKFAGLLAAKARTAKCEVDMAAVSLPCDLSLDRRTVLNFPQATWLNQKPLADILQSALGLPVVMERRALVRLSYDRVMLGIPENALTIGCYVDEHYENAVWYRGAPIMGKHGAAGNIGHMTIHDREDNCFCGKCGCVDLYGSGVRLRQLHSMIFPDTPFERIFEKHGQHPIFKDYLHMMAYPIAMEANLLDPDFIVLGGFIPSMRGFPMSVLESSIREITTHPYPANGLVFLPSAAGAISGVVTTAQYARMKTDKESGA